MTWDWDTFFTAVVAVVIYQLSGALVRCWRQPAAGRYYIFHVRVSRRLFWWWQRRRYGYRKDGPSS